MEVKPKKKPSWAVIRRMPKYYRYLCDLSKAGESKISSNGLAALMGLTASQVRQDFNCFGGFGQQGYGYPVEDLKVSIAKILGLDKRRQGIVIGAGNLGHALLTNFNFQKCGVHIIAAFDVKPELIGRSIGQVPVLDMDGLVPFVVENRPEIAVLTLPKGPAQSAAVALTDNGVRGIWNFTNIDLDIPHPQARVENVHFDESLMVLSYQLEAPETPEKEGD